MTVQVASTNIKEQLANHFLRKIKMFTTFKLIVILLKIYPKKRVPNIEKNKQANKVSFH